MAQIITQNTEWTSGSTHVLSGTLQVAEGVTLQIDLGAVVSGGTIQVFGTLDVQGASNQQVQFDNVNLQMIENAASHPEMLINDAVLQGGSFLAAGSSSGGSFSLTNSTLRDVESVAGVWPSSNVVISGNLFDGFGGFSINTLGPQVLISHNSFLNIEPPLAAASAIMSFEDNAPVVVDHNNFLDVGTPTLALPSGSIGSMTATNNYFGTSDPAVIATMISDRSNNLNSPGYISIAPVLSSPDLTAPSWPMTPTITTIGGPDDVISGQPSDAVVRGTAAGSSTVALSFLPALQQTVLLGTTTVDGSGNWSYTLTPTNIASMGQGAGKVVQVTAMDMAGNPSDPTTSLSFAVDTTAPVVSAVSASPSDAILGAGALVNLTLGFSEAVTVTGGTPTLTLNNGGTATFASGSGTNALTFSYTVAGGQDVPDLAVTAANLNGATVTDQAGNAATLSGAAVNPAGTLAIEPSAIAGFDTTTNQPVGIVAQAYTGPVVSLQNEYINITSDNLSVALATPNWFIHSGSGDDAIAANSGINVLDGGTGSNFLTGGNGTDTFFVDDRSASADIWSTVSGFHAGDAATIWGVTPQDFSLTWVDGQGAAGYTGLTLHATASGQPTASLTLAGYTSADLSDGRLSVSFGTVGGSAYMYVHGNS